MNFELIVRNISVGLWPLSMADIAYKKGLITEAQRDEIYAIMTEPQED